MMRLYECLVVDHDLRLVLAAAVLCVFAALVTVSVVRRAAENSGRWRAGWLLGAGFATGVGAWGTHFIAMLAYTPEASITFGASMTLFSLAFAVVAASAGWAAAVIGGTGASRVFGGAIVGLGIVAMHYLGMEAVVADARMEWNAGFVAVSVASGGLFGALAAESLLCRQTTARAYIAAALWTTGVVALHFTGMAGLTLTPDPTLSRPEGVMSPFWLAWTVALGAVAVLVVGLIGAGFDQHLASRRKREHRRMRDFADASFEGLAIADPQGLVSDVNARLEIILGVSRGALRGRRLSEFVAGDARCMALENSGEGVPHPCVMIAQDGRSVPVEILSRAVEVDGRPARVFAVRDMSEREAAEARILHMAHHDDLTGLANRARFNEALHEALESVARTGGQAAVICFDLDRFKIVNDVHGHAAGDALLVELSARINEELPDGALAARLGGDEFSVIVTGFETTRTVIELAERLVSRVSEPYDFEGAVLSVGASAGAALYPRDGADPETLVSRADMALYRAKHGGGDGVRLFEASMDEQLRERRRMEADLRAALVDGGLELHYQPQAASDTGAVVGFEALVRWNRPGAGQIGPIEFIALAEETGLILPLGEWVLNEACAEAARWPRPHRIAVNVSPAQFKQGNLVYTVQRALERSGLEPERLELEITEGVLIEDEARARDMLQWLKALGVRIAMDDFGTGYSSLNYLRSFPFDKIKLDRSFITGLTEQHEARAIVRATASLARDLGLTVVAEGVETAADLATLREESPVEIQGFLLSRPVTPGALAPFFADEPPYLAVFAAPVAVKAG